MKQVACVNSLSSSSAHTSVLWACSIGHVARYTPSAASPYRAMSGRNLMIN